MTHGPFGGVKGMQEQISHKIYVKLLNQNEHGEGAWRAVLGPEPQHFERGWQLLPCHALPPGLSQIPISC